MKKNLIKLIDPKSFETTINGKAVSLYTLDSGNGIVMQVTNYGGRVVALWVPDKDGTYEDVVLGYDSIEKYLNNPGERYLGATIGRYANRIKNGQFEINGKLYQVPIRNEGYALHGGAGGFDVVVWSVDKVTSNSLELSYISPDGEEGFPGNLSVKMTYTLTPDNEFKIGYEAKTDKPTIVNLSHHSYFNLKGEGNGTVLDNFLKLNASRYLPVNNISIPTGQLAPVQNTPLDFTVPHIIGERINTDNEQLKYGAGYDHCWVIDKKSEDELAQAAIVYEPVSGRVMEVYTDQPGIQFYSSNWFDNKTTGKSGKPYKVRESLALETQKFPDSPNNPNFPSTLLMPGEVYKHTCVYKFSTKEQN